MRVPKTSPAGTVQINGPALRRIRELTGVSGAALARAVGADISYLAKIERGEKRGLARPTWERIAMRLGIDGRAILCDPFGSGVVSRMDRTGPTVVPCVCKTSTAA